MPVDLLCQHDYLQQLLHLNIFILYISNKSVALTFTFRWDEITHWDSRTRDSGALSLAWAQMIADRVSRYICSGPVLFFLTFPCLCLLRLSTAPWIWRLLESFSAVAELVPFLLTANVSELFGWPFSFPSVMFWLPFCWSSDCCWHRVSKCNFQKAERSLTLY